MTMRVNDHRGPHIYVQRLIHRARERGAARAGVEIHKGRLEYQDDLGTHETIDTSHVEPDGTYTIVRTRWRSTGPPTACTSTCRTTRPGATWPHGAGAST